MCVSAYLCGSVSIFEFAYVSVRENCTGKACD